MFLFALSVCWRAPTVSLFTPSVNTEVVQTFIFCCLWVWNEPFWQFASLTSDLLLLLQFTMQSAAERVWRLHLFVSGAKASTLQPASASWPERRMNGSEWIWSEPLWRLFVLKVLNWLTSGRLWIWGRVLFCSQQETELWPKLERQLSCSHVFKENSLQFVVSEERSCRHLH